MADDDDGVLFVGTKHEMAVHDKSQKEEKKMAALTPAMMKSRRNPTKQDARDVNWNAQYKRASDQCQEDKFANLVSGDPIYSWITQAKGMVGRFDRKGVSSSRHDADCGSGAWKSQRIAMVRPLVEAFEERARSATKKQRSATKKRNDALSHHRKPSPLPFYKSAVVPDENAKCTNCFNQGLYEELCGVASYRLMIGHARKSTYGHTQMAKDWFGVASLILNVSCAVTRWLAFSVAFVSILTDMFAHPTPLQFSVTRVYRFHLQGTSSCRCWSYRCAKGAFR
jgi:hypothetical protein